MYEFQIEEGQQGAGDTVSVDFEAMMNAKDGFLTLPDGRTAKRVNRPSEKKRTGDDSKKSSGLEISSAGPEIVSDALGFTDNQLADMERDRVANGFHGVEFRPDPTEPRFMQVVCSSERVKSAYMRHRGFFDQNSKNGSGNIIDASQLDAARQMVIERFGKPLADPSIECRLAD